MENFKSDKETEVLLRYMIAHNKSHVKEMEELAESLKKNKKAYEEIKKAISSFDEGNGHLEESLNEFLKSR